jgi:hypothetical protein
MVDWVEYYSNAENIAKISKECKYREVVIIRQVEDRKITLRPIKIFKPEHLEFWIERLNLLKTTFDIYISNASVRLPKLTADISKLYEAREYLNEHWNELITGFDIFIDIDVESEEQRPLALAYAKKIKTLLKDDYPNIQIWDTGNGYHLIEKGQFTPEFIKDLIMDLCCKHQIPMSIPVKTVDDKRYLAKDGKWVEVPADFQTPEIPKPNIDSSIYQWRRIRRVPYGLNSKTGRPMVKIM